jgi:hypothetical protein
MSDTYRWTQPGWDGPDGTMSKKHQSRDHGPLNRLKRDWRFMKDIKNIRYNLQRKIDDLRLREGVSSP